MSARHRTRPAPRQGLLAGLLVVGLAGAGCSLQASSPPAKHTSTPSPTDTPTATVTVTDSASPTPSDTPSSPSVTGPTANGPIGSLLSAAELPVPAGVTTWSEQSTGAANTDPFGVCAKVDLSSIGAQTVVDRSFTAGANGTALAGQQVADAPDALTASRIGRVLQSWHDSCGQRVPGTLGTLGPLLALSPTRGSGWWYRVSWTTGGQQHRETFGMVVSGTRLSVLRIDQAGQAPAQAGQDPVERGLLAISARLGS